jgi:hypothetical protein
MSKLVNSPSVFRQQKPFVQPAAHVRVPAEALSARIWKVLQPILASRPTPPSIAQLHVVVNVIVTIWNAHFMSLPPWKQPEYLAKIRSEVDATMGGPGRGDALIASILDIVKTQFSDECRIIGKFAVTQGDDGKAVITCNAILHDSLLAK